MERIEASQVEETGELDASAAKRLEYWQENIRYFTVASQLVQALLHTGMFNAKYNSKHHFYLTDGIMPQAIGWPLPEIYKEK